MIAIYPTIPATTIFIGEVSSAGELVAALQAAHLATRAAQEHGYSLADRFITYRPRRTARLRRHRRRARIYPVIR